MLLNPLDLPAHMFLPLYIALICGAVIMGLIIPRWLREDGRDGATRDVGELAYLAGGHTRFADAVVTRLLSINALTMIGKDQFGTRDKSRAVTRAERDVVSLQPPVGWSPIARTLKAAAEPVQRRLISAGLMLDGDEVMRLRLWQAAPYVLVLFFGAAKWIIGSHRGHPVGFLIALMVVTLVLGLIRFFAVDRRTRAGIAELADAQAANERIKRAPVSDEYGLAVALFGTAVLAASPLAAFHALRSSSGGDGGGGGSDGDGGCGGGGCGGCS